MLIKNSEIGNINYMTNLYLNERLLYSVCELIFKQVMTKSNAPVVRFDIRCHLQLSKCDSRQP